MTGRVQTHGGSGKTQGSKYVQTSGASGKGNGQGGSSQGSTPTGKTTTVKTKQGDTLASLASQYGVTSTAIRAHNSGDKKVLSAKDDDKLTPGTSVVVPASRKAKDAYNSDYPNFSSLSGGGNTKDNPDDLDYGSVMPAYTGSALSTNADWTSGGSAAITQGDSGSNNGNNPNVGSTSGTGDSGSANFVNKSVSLPGNVSDWIDQAFKLLKAAGVPASELSKSAVEIIISHESGGDPNAENKKDINWQEGHPSIGLMQTIGTTFAAHALPGHDNIRNPVDNIIAGVRYALSRYHSLDQVPGVEMFRRNGGYEGY